MRRKIFLGILGGVALVAFAVAIVLGLSGRSPFPPYRPYSTGPALPAGRVQPKVEYKFGTGLLLAPDGSLWIFGGGNSSWGYRPGVRQWPSAVPQRFGTDSDWVDVAQGAHHGVGLKADGSLWVWGEGAAVPSSRGGSAVVPGRFGAETNWIAVAAGASQAVALRRDGTIWSWGQNNYGELGDGTVGGIRSSPVQALGDGYVRIAVGDFMTFGMRRDGSLWAWGSEGNGGTNAVPARVGSNFVWRTFAAGAYHFGGIRDDGSLWVAGGNSHLVDDSRRAPAPTVEPARLGTETNWVEIFSGDQHLYVRKTDGTWWGFGRGDQGELGLGTNPSRAAMPAGRGWKVEIEGALLSADGGDGTAVALAPDGMLWAWGVRPGPNPRRYPWTRVVEAYGHWVTRWGLPAMLRPNPPSRESWWEPRPLWSWPDAAGAGRAQTNSISKL